MKIFYSTLGLFLAAVLISSCSIMERNGFSKQKYTNYKRSDLDNPTSKREVGGGKRETITKKREEGRGKWEITQEKIVVNPVSEKTVVFNEPVVKNNPVQVDKQIINRKSSIINSEDPEIVNRPSHFLNQMFKPLGYASTEESDAMLILLIILAILLPPLAVLLKEGVTKHFWIVLVLCLLAFSFVFSYFLSILWLVGIILALLSVLGKW
jgi:uncharacterized membrane protein YqaE (UPF0057 family)